MEPSNRNPTNPLKCQNDRTAKINPMENLNEMWVFKRPPTPKNTYTILVAYVLTDASWDRVLGHKGIHSRFPAKRPMVPEEMKRANNSWRMIYLKYENMQLLLEDEWRVTGDRTWMQTLIDFGRCNTTVEQVIASVRD